MRASIGKALILTRSATALTLFTAANRNIDDAAPAFPRISRATYGRGALTRERGDEDAAGADSRSGRGRPALPARARPERPGDFGRVRLPADRHRRVAPAGVPADRDHLGPLAGP